MRVPIEDPVLGKITVEDLMEGLIHVRFSDQKILALTFLRFAEHFENPKFKGKYFKREEFVDWYTATKGEFTYHDDWDGFNIPSDILKPFFEGKFDPLSPEEKSFIGLFKERRGAFYIIGTAESSKPSTFLHEFSHALFYLHTSYREAVIKILQTASTPDIAEHLLTKLSYDQDVLQDEIHAYLLFEMDYLQEEGIDINKYAEVHKKLKTLFDTHSQYK